ncbi:MAG: hypothetical protein Q6366_015355 [Candidatus Freyarchaeota archaeon]
MIDVDNLLTREEELMLGEEKEFRGGRTVKLRFEEGSRVSLDSTEY